MGFYGDKMSVSDIDKFNWSYKTSLEQEVQKILEQDNFGHPYKHSLNVWNNALLIYDGEKVPVDMEIVFAACLIHDIGYTQQDKNDPSHTKHPEISAQIGESLLEKVGFPVNKIEDVKTAILLHDDTKPWGTFQKTNKRTIWYIQDADNIEALGQEGIERLIDLGKKTDQEFYVQGLPWDKKSASKSTLHNIYAHAHIYLHTLTARKLAEPKIKEMEKYIRDFLIKGNFKSFPELL